jgi:pimeloyl-ACP methyl ester carboxylesterase
MSQVEANGLIFEVELSGPENAPVVLLVHGLGMQMTGWPASLIGLLHKGGYRTLMYDQRDIGLSSKMDAAGRPNLFWAMLRHRFGAKVRAPYAIADMAEDVLAIARALGIAAFHLVGVSMGGMIGQHLAARRPEGLRSLCLVMSSSGAPGLPGATREVTRAMLAPMPKKGDEEALVARFVKIFTAIGSPAYPTPQAVLESMGRQTVRRSNHPAGALRHTLAIVADGDRSPMLGTITVPTLVIHGVADPLLPVQCGEDLAAKIPAARLITVPGMGHDLPDALMPWLADTLIDHFKAAP